MERTRRTATRAPSCMCAKVKKTLMWILMCLLKWLNVFIWKSVMFWGIVASCMHLYFADLRNSLCREGVTEYDLFLDGLIILLYGLYIVFNITQKLGLCKIESLKMMKRCIAISKYIRFGNVRFFNLKTSWYCWLYIIFYHLILDVIVAQMVYETARFYYDIDQLYPSEIEESEIEDSNSGECGIQSDCQEIGAECQNECSNIGNESSQDTVIDSVSSYSYDQRQGGNSYKKVGKRTLQQIEDEPTQWFVHPGMVNLGNAVKHSVTGDSEEADDEVDKAACDETSEEGGDDKEIEPAAVAVEASVDNRNLFRDVSSPTSYSSLEKVVKWIQVNQYYFEQEDAAGRDEEHFAASEKSYYDCMISEYVQQFERGDNLMEYEDEEKESDITQVECSFRYSETEESYLTETDETEED